MQDLGCTSEEASQLSTYVLLTLGLSNIFALPAASLIGKRYTILISLVLFFGFCLWGAEALTFNSLRASRIVGGLAGGLVEALGPSIVAETFPESQLASSMVVYVGLLAAGSSLGPILAGVVADGVGDWRWYFRILAALIFVTFLGSLIMLPETRVHTSAIEPVASADEYNLKRITSDANWTEIEEAQTQEPELQGAESSSRGRQWWLRSFTLAYVDMDWKIASTSLVDPVRLIAAPQVLVTTLVFGLTIGWTVMVSILVAIVYARPPMLWTARPVGLLSIGPLLGLLIGLPIGGALADYLYVAATKRSGRQDPASRLPAVVIGGLVSPAGCLVIGYGLQSPEKWAQVSIGWGMLSTGLTCSANVLLTYAVDTMPARASHIGVLVNLIKNCIGFGVLYAAINWMDQMGPAKQFGIIGGILWMLYLLVVPVYLFSDRIIKRTSSLA
ncbi:putative MFS-type transporter [Colletotrichum orbiculare MAFF 240422]|uniref:MFS-type transporter n=1 Tax=Colletotrichum orbiculare (strain 104-T / ATCC 96160 / CBS 514.97 / LARS 414 / MAFF 240422) TaxID=1213857 RepID=N4V6C2_COLOR|nr:putative MFS-type transporter [Colletotrichum orbiculare MAFF 240422]